MARQLLGGTTISKLRLRSVPTAVTSSTGIVNFVYALQWTNCIDYTSWGAVFDEYKFGNGRFRFFSTTTPGGSLAGTLATGMAAVDYDSSDAFGSVGACAAFDTSKLVFFESDFANEVTWPIVFQGPPDQVWTSTATDLAAAYLKFVNMTNCGTRTLGYVDFEVDVTFRQID
jgi:hypothetical protein